MHMLAFPGGLDGIHISNAFCVGLQVRLCLRLQGLMALPGASRGADHIAQSQTEGIGDRPPTHAARAQSLHIAHARADLIRRGFGDALLGQAGQSDQGGKILRMLGASRFRPLNVRFR